MARLACTRRPSQLPSTGALFLCLHLRALQAITNLTGFPVECASLPPAWQVDATWINDQVAAAGWAVACCGGALPPPLSEPQPRLVWPLLLRVLRGNPIPRIQLTRIAVLQVYCGWGSSECIVRDGQKVYLPPQGAGGNSTNIQ